MHKDNIVYFYQLLLFTYLALALWHSSS